MTIDCNTILYAILLVRQSLILIAIHSNLFIGLANHKFEMKDTFEASFFEVNNISSLSFWL